MYGIALDPDRGRQPGRWPQICERDAAAVRLEICRHLLARFGDQREGGPADFAEIGRFLCAWDEERIQMDAGGFCTDAVRMLALVLAHLEREHVPLDPRMTLAVG